MFFWSMLEHVREILKPHYERASSVYSSYQIFFLSGKLKIKIFWSLIG